MHWLSGNIIFDCSDHMLAILKIAFLDTCKCLWKVGVFIVFGVVYYCGLYLLLKCAQFMQKIDLNIMKRLHMRWLNIAFLQIAKNPKMKFGIYSPFNWPFEYCFKSYQQTMNKQNINTKRFLCPTHTNFSLSTMYCISTFFWNLFAPSNYHVR